MFVPRIPQTLSIGEHSYDGSRKNPTPGRYVPYLRMCGVWMQELDFRPGDKVAVHAEKGVITLRVLTEERAAPAKKRGRKKDQ